MENLHFAFITKFTGFHVQRHQIKFARISCGSFWNWMGCLFFLQMFMSKLNGGYLNDFPYKISIYFWYKHRVKGWGLRVFGGRDKLSLGLFVESDGSHKNKLEKRRTVWKVYNNRPVKTFVPQISHPGVKSSLHMAPKLRTTIRRYSHKITTLKLFPTLPTSRPILQLPHIYNIFACKITARQTAWSTLSSYLRVIIYEAHCVLFTPLLRLIPPGAGRPICPAILCTVTRTPSYSKPPTQH